MSWHFKYPLCWNVLSAQNRSDSPWRGRVGLGVEVGEVVPVGGVEDCTHRNKAFLSQNNGQTQKRAWPQALCRSFDAFLSCCLRCLGESQTARTCGRCVQLEIHLLSCLRVQTMIPWGRERLWGRKAGRQESTLLVFTLFHRMKCWNLIRSETMTNPFLQSPRCNSRGQGKASNFTCTLQMPEFVCAVENGSELNGGYEWCSCKKSRGVNR